MSDLQVNNIKILIHSAQYLKELTRYNINFEIWHQNTINTLINTFDEKSQAVYRFKSIQFDARRSPNYDFALSRVQYIKAIEDSIQFLTDCCHKIIEDELSLDLFGDVENYLEGILLPRKDKEKLTRELNDSISAIRQGIDIKKVWELQVQQNKVAKVLNELSSLSAQQRGIT